MPISRLPGTRPGWRTWGCNHCQGRAWWGTWGHAPHPPQPAPGPGDLSHTPALGQEVASPTQWGLTGLGLAWTWFHPMVVGLAGLFYYRERANTNIKIFPLISSLLMCANIMQWTTSMSIKLSLRIWRALIPGPLWIPKSVDAQVPYIKWLSICL